MTVEGLSEKFYYASLTTQAVQTVNSSWFLKFMEGGVRCYDLYRGTVIADVC